MHFCQTIVENTRILSTDCVKNSGNMQILSNDHAKYSNFIKKSWKIHKCWQNITENAANFGKRF